MTLSGPSARCPGLSVLTRVGDDVYLAYQSTARGLEVVMEYYEILDRVPLGRDEHDPTFQSWIRHRGRYGSESTPTVAS
jgi:predicted dithiol-disulfide oxidoreductase (DUF899 family)